MDVDSKKGIFHQLHLSKFHWLVFEKWCQALPAVRADIKGHLEWNA